jgi:hypothetical protein
MVFGRRFMIGLLSAVTSPERLAHVVENKTEAAYRRGDLFDKRRLLMDAWADYCGKPAVPSRVNYRQQQRSKVRF